MARLDCQRFRLQDDPRALASLPVSATVRLLALLLAILWLPITAHCGLASMGIGCSFAGACDEHPGSMGCGHHPSDACNSIERGLYDPKQNSISSLLVPPFWISSADALDRLLRPDPAKGLPENTRAMPESRRIWQFVFRAAPHPRAP